MRGKGRRGQASTDLQLNHNTGFDAYFGMNTFALSIVFFVRN